MGEDNNSQSSTENNSTKLLTEPKEKLNIGVWLAGFIIGALIPLLGLIFFGCMSRSNPSFAKGNRDGAIISIVLVLAYVVFAFLFSPIHIHFA